MNSTRPFVVSTQFIEPSGYAITCVVDAATDDNIEEIVAFANRTGSHGLMLPGAALSARGVGALEQMAVLRYLSLERSNLSDDALANLPNTSALETLILAKNPLSGTALASLLLPSVSLLDLCETSIDDAAVQNIVRFNSLGTVRLSNTRVTIEGVVALGGLPALQIIWAQGNRIGLFALASAPIASHIKVLI